MTNRCLNCIENIKRQLEQQEEPNLFNDLLILRHIVPSLPTDSIRSLLHELRPHKSLDSPIISQLVDFDKINIILSQVKRPNQLLTDFLACSGVVPIASVWSLRCLTCYISFFLVYKMLLSLFSLPTRFLLWSKVFIILRKNPIVFIKILKSFQNDKSFSIVFFE